MSSNEKHHEMRTFADVVAIQESATSALRSVPKKAFADSFQKRYKRCQKVAVAITLKTSKEFICIFCFVCFMIPYTKHFRHSMSFNVNVISVNLAGVVTICGEMYDRPL